MSPEIPKNPLFSLETKGMFINSKREGIWQRFHPDGKIFCNATYKKGAIIEWECFDALGQPEQLSMVMSNKRKPYIDVMESTYTEHDDNCDCSFCYDLPF